ncbi:hypothetical protein U9M48_019497 [Paspalum notatum var. saurae]|uniref:Reverse transcriptase Ty1/copia-type domain-containing protein n=1 Tax=Paspalum notatum var. saurae TaxID=547442 RepID=A0AAQ3TCE3_PASNO
MDVKSAFPNRFIEEEVYVRQPPGFESARFPDRVYKLRKALYGPKQASRAWFVMGSYTRDTLKKFDMGDSKPMTTPMSTNTALDADKDGEAEFRGMIGSLLVRRRPGRTFGSRSVFVRVTVASPRTSHRQAVKRIFRYLKFTPELGLWYSSVFLFFLEGSRMPTMLGCRIDRKSTSAHANS